MEGKYHIMTDNTDPTSRDEMIEKAARAIAELARRGEQA